MPAHAIHNPSFEGVVKSLQFVVKEDSHMGYHHKQDMRIYTGPFVAGHQPYIIADEILTELKKARSKFPEQNIWVTLAALTEEVGELNKAVLQLNYEPHKGVSPEEIYAEAVQVAVMAIRVALDCDYSSPSNSERLREENAALRASRDDWSNKAIEVQRKLTEL